MLQGSADDHHRARLHLACLVYAGQVNGLSNQQINRRTPLCCALIFSSARSTSCWRVPLVAGPDKAPTEPVPTPEPRISLWEFTVRPYGWLSGIEGTSGVGGFRTEVDFPFKTVLENLDMYAAMQLEVRRDRFMLLLDGMYIKLSARGETPGRLLETIDVEFEQVMAEAAFGYRLWQNERGFVDVFAGARYMHMRFRAFARARQQRHSFAFGRPQPRSRPPCHRDPLEGRIRSHRTSREPYCRRRALADSGPGGRGAGKSSEFAAFH